MSMDEVVSWLKDAEPEGGEFVLASVPTDESCAQVSSTRQYRGDMIAECVALKEQLARMHGPMPAGVSLHIVTYPHSGGPHSEVVCRHADDDGHGAALDIADNPPDRWDRQAKKRLGELGHNKYESKLPSSKSALLNEVEGRLAGMDCVAPHIAATTVGFATMKLDADALQRFLAGRIRTIDLMIASVGHLEFRELCDTLSSCTDGDEIFDVLGVTETESDTDFLAAASEKQNDPVPCLYAVANYLAQPLDFPPHLELAGRMYLSNSLWGVGRGLDALFVLEDHLGLEPEDYQNQSDFLGRMMQSLESKAPGEFLAAYCQTLVNRLLQLGLNEEAIHADTVRKVYDS